MVDTHREETSTTQVSGETLRQQPEREDQPKTVQGNAVGQGRFRRVPHAKDDGPEPLKDSQRYSRKDIKQEKVHQEEEE